MRLFLKGFTSFPCAGGSGSCLSVEIVLGRLQEVARCHTFGLLYWTQVQRLMCSAGYWDSSQSISLLWCHEWSGPMVKIRERCSYNNVSQPCSLPTPTLTLESNSMRIRKLKSISINNIESQWLATPSTSSSAYRRIALTHLAIIWSPNSMRLRPDLMRSLSSLNHVRSSS